MFNITKKPFVKEESHRFFSSNTNIFPKLLIFQKKIARLKDTIDTKFNYLIDYLIKLENFYQINKTRRITLIINIYTFKY